MISFHEAYKIISEDSESKPAAQRTVEMLEFVQLASAQDLQAFLLLSRRRPSTINDGWLESAKIAIQVRISEDANTSANKLLTHTEKLTHLTELHIVEAKTLTNQTNVLIRESKKLGWLTWALFAVTLGLFALTAVLILLEMCK